jgi:hypothetical protein
MELVLNCHHYFMVLTFSAQPPHPHSKTANSAFYAVTPLPVSILGSTFFNGLEFEGSIACCALDLVMVFSYSLALCAFPRHFDFTGINTLGF